MQYTRLTLLLQFLAVTTFACSHYQLVDAAQPLSVETVTINPMLNIDTAATTRQLVADLNASGISATWSGQSEGLRCRVESIGDGVSESRIAARVAVTCEHGTTVETVDGVAVSPTQGAADTGASDQVFRTAIADAVLQAALLVLG